MIPIHPIRMMIIGGILVTFAVCASFAMVLRLAESTFLLNFAIDLYTHSLYRARAPAPLSLTE